MATELVTGVLQPPTWTEYVMSMPSSQERAPEIVPEGVLGEHGGQGDVEAEPGQGHGHVGHPAGRDPQVRRPDLGAGTGRGGQTGEDQVEADRADDVHPPGPPWPPRRSPVGSSQGHWAASGLVAVVTWSPPAAYSSRPGGPGTSGRHIGWSNGLCVAPTAR